MSGSALPPRLNCAHFLDESQAFQIREAVRRDSDQILACLRIAFAPYENLYTPAAFADTVLDALTINARMQRMHMLVATWAVKSSEPYPGHFARMEKGISAAWLFCRNIRAAE